MSELSDALELALEKAREETGISIPVSYVGIYDAPYNYLKRVKALTRTFHQGGRQNERYHFNSKPYRTFGRFPEMTVCPIRF